MQINYPHLASKVFNAPLYCTEALYNSVAQVLLPRVMGINTTQNAININAQSDESDEEDGELEPLYLIENGVTMIKVHGVLLDRGGGIDAQCNEIVSYESLWNKINILLAEGAEHIVLDVNSTGGVVLGCVELADKIYELRQQGVYFTAIVNYITASAAYFIASACNEIIVSKSSKTGSIGVVLAHTDMSKRLEDEGLNITLLYRGHRKVDANQTQALSTEAETQLNESLDEAYDVFTYSVAKYRNMKQSTVIATQAKVYNGEAAVKVGLADKLMHPQDVINQIYQNAQRKALKSKSTRKITAQVAAMKMKM